jgi:hypothetical protein
VGGVDKPGSGTVFDDGVGGYSVSTIVKHDLRLNFERVAKLSTQRQTGFPLAFCFVLFFFKVGFLIELQE